MENKYYTPKIEEFHVGFQFEYFDTSGKLVKDHPSNKAEWKVDTCDWSWLDIICDDYEHNPEDIESTYRVPYLTAEQIIAEGWLKSSVSEENFYYIKNRDVEVFYDFNSHRLSIMRKPNGPDYTYLFNGKCKSINEFRQIIKFLEI